MTAHRCPPRGPTIGCGHTDGVTETAAVDILAKVPLTANQRGALAPFAFIFGDRIHASNRF